MGEHHDLKNRRMLIDAPDRWTEIVDKAKATDDKIIKTDDKINESDDKPTLILSLIKSEGCVTTSQLASYLGLKPTQTKHYIYQLLKEGKIVAHGANRNRTYTLS